MFTGFYLSATKLRIARWSSLDSFGNNVAIINISAFSTYTSEVNECYNIPMRRCLHNSIGDPRR